MVNRFFGARFTARARYWLSMKPFLGALERVFLIRQYDSQQPQLFILGLPRSGTTIVYQYIVHRLHMSYFTNRAGDYFLSPCVITSLQRNELDAYYSDFQSQYGKVQGPLAPREAGAIWGRFFDLQQYSNFHDVPLREVKTLQNTVACIQCLFGDLPFVNKNVKHMLRIDALSHIFPNSYFLIVERELSQVALSVLRGRYANLEDPQKWWSVKPPNYTELMDLPLVEQVAGQLISLQNRMNSDFSKVSSRRLLRLSYESFCQSPETLISRLNSVLGEIQEKNAAEKSFRASRKSPQSDEEIRLMNMVMDYEAA